MATKGLVAVTGATGYIGSRICQDLLAHSYKVRAVVRTVAKADTLKTLPNAAANLELFEVADLVTGDYTKAFSGADFVIHTATPLKFTAPDPENDIIRPAVEGTYNVLKTAKESGVKRVVFTATMASMCGSQREKNPNHVWSEEDWNDAPGSHYSRSKTLAEQKAWQYAKESGLELVTIHPSFVIGPITIPRDSYSINNVTDLLNGKYKDTGVPQSAFGLVDVRDVSLAHILAIENPAAAGNRYIAGSKDQYSYFELAQNVKRLFPQYPIPDFEDYKEKPSNPMKNGTNNEKIQKHLGLKLTPLDDTIRDMVASALENGLAPKL